MSNNQPQVGHKEISLTENKQHGCSIQITFFKNSRERFLVTKGYDHERKSGSKELWLTAAHSSLISKVKNTGSTTRHSQYLLLRNTVQC